jgi:hypothetical protein
LRNIGAARQLGPRDWDQLLVTARSASLLGVLALRLRQAGLLAAAPSTVRRHLLAAEMYAESSARHAEWDAMLVARALADVDTPIVLLKGIAYRLAGLDIAAGRSFRDLDILVHREQLENVESALRTGGWESILDGPDHVAYFRQWMHELPPLRHRHRKIVLDIHHSIVPRTDTIRLDPQLLLDAAVPAAPGNGRLRVLAPEDMLLHSALHLFRNGEYSFGLRDLVDMHALVNTFACQAGFWQRLLDRTGQLDLRVPCALAMRYARRLLQTPVPPDAAGQLERWLPSITPLLDRLVPTALVPVGPAASETWRQLSSLALSYYPPPHPRAMLTGSFWRKRLQPKFRSRPVR